jgi:site-specific recombinase XerD
MTNDSWLNDPIITKWFTIVKNKRTQENYRREFPYYLEFVQENTEFKTPSQIIESRIQQLKSDDMNIKRYWEDIGIKYMHFLEDKGYRKNTITTYLRTMLSFFSHAHVKLQYARKELIGAIEPNIKDKVIKEWIPNNEDARIIYRVSQSSRDKAIFLALYQSGLSPTDVCALNIQHFNFYDDKGNWIADKHQYLCKLREKTNIRQQTFLSVECVDELKIYLQSRGFPKKGALFISVHNNRLSSRDINDICKGIVEQAFNKRVKDWKTKNLRDSFMNALVRAKIPTEVKNLFVGHIRKNAQKDYDMTEETLRPLYEDAFKFLSINGIGKTSRQIEELQKQMQEKELQDTERFRTLTDTITQQKNDIKELKEAIKGLYHVQGTYPKTMHHTLFNRKTGKMETWTETINNTQEEVESLKRFIEKAKKLSEI